MKDAIVPHEYEYKPGFYLGASSFNLEWVDELGLEKKGLMLDIGAYDGGDAVRFYRAFPECVVYSFEMSKSRYEKIIKAINEPIDFKNLALSDTNGEIEYFVSVCNLKDAGSTHTAGEVGGQCSIFDHSDFYKKTYPHIETIKKEKVQSVKLNSLFYDKADILLAHIDVEGAEMNVIKGMGELRPKLIFIETLEGMFKGAANKEEIDLYLKSIGYEMIKDCVSDRLYIHK